MNRCQSPSTALRAPSPPVLFDMEQIIQRYDRNGDRKLDQAETAAMYQLITIYLRAKSEAPGIQPRKRVLDPLISDKIPSPAEMLSTYDTNRDLSLDAAELAKMAVEIQKPKWRHDE